MFLRSGRQIQTTTMQAEAAGAAGAEAGENPPNQAAGADGNLPNQAAGAAAPAVQIDNVTVIKAGMEIASREFSHYPTFVRANVRLIWEYLRRAHPV